MTQVIFHKLDHLGFPQTCLGQSDMSDAEDMRLAFSELFIHLSMAETKPKSAPLFLKGSCSCLSYV